MIRGMFIEFFGRGEEEDVYYTVFIVPTGDRWKVYGKKGTGLTGWAMGPQLIGEFDNVFVEGNYKNITILEYGRGFGFIPEGYACKITTKKGIKIEVSGSYCNLYIK